MEKNNGVKTVTLRDFWQVFLRSLPVIILATAVAVVGLFVLVKVYFKPDYKSTATLYILRQEDSETGGSVSSDFSLALNVVNDCEYLLKSHSVLDQVISNLGLDMTYNTLYGMIKCNNPDGTRILEVSVVADTPEEAKRIVDSVCQVGTEKITSAMGFRQVNPYQSGSLAITPDNAVGKRTYVLVAGIAAILTYLVFFIAFLLDDRLETEEDVERVLGLSTLGRIPEMNSSASRRKNVYGVYGSPEPERRNAATKEG